MNEWLSFKLRDILKNMLKSFILFLHISTFYVIFLAMHCILQSDFFFHDIKIIFTVQPLIFLE